jgi:hypothetical protein
MRGNEIVEDILIIAAVICIMPIMLLSLLVFGVSLLYTWPIVLWALIILFVVRAKKHHKQQVTMGRCKPLKVPDVVKQAAALCISIPITILILVLMACGLILMPMKWAAIVITMCILISIFKRCIK